MKARLIFSVAATLLISANTAFAKDVITFPEEELASESVLPVFDNPVSVKNRNVVTAKRIELGVQGGYSLTEPFFNPASVGVTASYHLTEVHAINLLGSFNMSGTSSYATQLNPIPKEDGTTSGINANLQYAPATKYIFLASYQYTAFYGKLSVTKNTVVNLGLFGTLGAGMMGIGDSSVPVLSVGLGQKFYLTDSLALRFDLREFLYQGPDILSKTLDQKTSEQSASYFDQKLQFGAMLSVGAVYLLPAF